MRKFTVKHTYNGVWEAIQKGMSVSDFAFDTPVVTVRFDHCRSMQSDLEAMRADVRRAERNFFDCAEQRPRWISAN